MAFRSPITGRFISNAAYARWYAPGAPKGPPLEAPVTSERIISPDSVGDRPQFIDDTPSGSDIDEFSASLYDDSFGDDFEEWDDIYYYYDDVDYDFADEDGDQYAED